MPIVKQQIASRTKGAMGENEDWWYLCYDTDTETFHVLHEWSYVKINGLKVDSGSEKHDADAWAGQGSEAIADLRPQLIARANA